METTFVVVNENTFGYIEGSMDKPFLRMMVLAIDILKGGDQFHLGEFLMVKRPNYRIATSDDFKHFRIVEQGYRERPQYTYVRL